MAYSAIDVAKHIINYCYDQNKPISNLKLQKILYFAWIDYYNETGGKRLFNDKICAWTYGPAVPEVYYRFSYFVSSPISVNFESNLPSYDQAVLNRIVDRYIDIPVYKLVSKTHEKGHAWNEVFNGGKGDKEPIPFDLIIAMECNK